MARKISARASFLTKSESGHKASTKKFLSRPGKIIVSEALLCIIPLNALFHSSSSFVPGTFSCSRKTLQNQLVGPIAISFYSYMRGSTVIPLDMEVDVRLLVLTILSASIKAQDDGAKGRKALLQVSL